MRGGDHRRDGVVVPDWADEVKSLDLAAQYLGVQEVTPNDGPVLKAMRAGLGLPDEPMSWCGAFVAWILSRAYVAPGGSLRQFLTHSLGFRSPFYLESTRDWLAQAKTCGMLTDKPEPGDLFILTNGLGQAHHIGFVMTAPLLGHFGTIEGNTNAGGSVNGDGVYRRERVAFPSVKFIRLPELLKG